MKRFFTERPMVAWFIVAVAATVISAWIINPKEGPLAWLINAGGSVDQLTLKVLAAAAILCVGASVTYIAWRLAQGAQTAYAGGTSIPNLRMLRVPDHQPERSPQSAIDELDAMIGLAPVKDEVNKLIARLQVEQKRREQGLPVTPMSLHMVFTGPPGVGKTQVARALTRRSSTPLLIAQPKQVAAHDPNPLPKTNQDRIVRAEKLMSSDPS
jgi:stage V sporulation protein K